MNLGNYALGPKTHPDASLLTTKVMRSDMHFLYLDLAKIYELWHIAMSKINSVHSIPNQYQHRQRDAQGAH